MLLLICENKNVRGLSDIFLVIYRSDPVGENCLFFKIPNIYLGSVFIYFFVDIDALKKLDHC